MTIFINNARLAVKHTLLFAGLNLTFTRGQWTCLLGPSGVGKSTLLRLIANLTSPSIQASADISYFDNKPLVESIAYLGQTDSLLPWLTVIENVLIGSTLRSESNPPRVRALELLAEVGLHKATKLLPGDLSGGMRQRVALVRTLLQEKPIVLMDEPFSSLDAITRFKLQNVAARLLHDKTVLLVTHDPLEALRLADEIIIMSGRPTLLHAPIHLKTPKPRDPVSTEVIELQAKLLHELAEAYENSL